MAGEATHPDLINGSLAGILSELEQDKTFLKLAAGDIEASDDVDNSVLAGIPEGLRPALAAAIGQGVAGKPGKPGRAGRGLRPRSRRDRGLAALLV